MALVFLRRWLRRIPAYLGICASIIPKDVALTVEQRLPGGLSPQDMEIFQAIRQAIPGANDRQPGEVGCPLDQLGPMRDKGS